MVGDFFSKESGILLIGSVYLHVCIFEATSIDSKWFASFKKRSKFPNVRQRLGQHAGFVRAMRPCTASYVCAFVTLDNIDRICLAICNSVSPFCSCEYVFFVFYLFCSCTEAWMILNGMILAGEVWYFDELLMDPYGDWWSSHPFSPFMTYISPAIGLMTTGKL